MLRSPRMATLSIPVILGQTASGKTSVGIDLARLLNGEIISIDSRKVYEGLPIGTATPAGEWEDGAYIVKGIPHHLMGFLSPDKPYAAGDFIDQADQLIRDITARGRTPILVGGTGFYFKALRDGLPELPKSDPAVRAKLEKRLAAEGVDAMREELIRVDPAAAGAITTGDRQKILRALEVLEMTGEPFSSWKDKKKPVTVRSYTVMGLHYAQEVLEKRIKERSAHMEKEGMIEEAAAVLKKGFEPTCPALASFGYREAVEVVLGKRPRSQFLPSLIKGTKAYAKRQRTWFRTQVQPFWFECGTTTNGSDIALKMKAFLEYTHAR